MNSPFPAVSGKFVGVLADALLVLGEIAARGDGCAAAENGRPASGLSKGFENSENHRSVWTQDAGKRGSVGNEVVAELAEAHRKVEVAA